MLFRVEFSYTMTGWKEVEAPSKEAAEEIVDNIPTDELGAEYLDDSFKFDSVKEIEQ